MTIWREFVEDDGGRGSASRLNMVLGVLIGSITILVFTYRGELGGEIFATYMLATGGVYGFSKWRESVSEVAQIKADSPNQEPPPAPNAPNTVIQVGGQPEVKDVAIEAKGTVNVNKRPRKA